MTKLNTIHGSGIGRKRFYVVKGSDLQRLAKGNNTDILTHILDRRHKKPNLAQQKAIDSINTFNKNSSQQIASRALDVGNNTFKINRNQKTDIEYQSPDNELNDKNNKTEPTDNMSNDKNNENDGV